MKNVHYSVPDSLVGEKVHVKVYSEKIVILYGKEKVASHQRSYCGGDWCIKLEHYLRTLSRKPGALPHSVVWQRAPEELRRLYDIHFKEDNRTFVLLLDYARKNGFSGTDIVTACKELTGRGVRKISPDQVKATELDMVAYRGDRRNHGTACSPGTTGEYRKRSCGYA